MQRGCGGHAGTRRRENTTEREPQNRLGGALKQEIEITQSHFFLKKKAGVALPCDLLDRLLVRHGSVNAELIVNATIRR